MPLRLFSKPLELPLGSRTLVARTPADLELGLQGRTSVSAARADALGALSVPDLEREGEALRDQEQRMIRALAREGDGRAGLDPVLAALDTSAVTEDQEWRSILAALGEAGPAARPYHRVVVGNYLAYVGAARDLVRGLLARRSDPRPGEEVGDPTADLGPRQALIFDLAALDGESGPESAPEFNRMPKGDTIEIELRPHQSLELLLAKHAFTLVAGSPFLLVDEHGNDVKLGPGKNVVGRSSQADAELDPCLRAISRRHLIVEIAADHRVRITDISTLGTFVPRAYLDNRLH